jgi:hypothetical protein
MKLKLSFLLFLLYAGLLFSQIENSEQSKSAETKNTWALQFQVLENFKINTFEGSTISLKKVLSDCSSLRFGVSINTTLSDVDEENKTTIAKNSQKYDQVSLNVSSFYLWNTPIKNDVSAYCGIGPTLSFGHYKTTLKNEGSNDETYTTTENIITENTFGIGVSGVIGVEWFVKDNLSILGEYETIAIYNFTKTKTEANQNNSSSDNTIEKKGNVFKFSSVGAKLGISIYF